MSFDVSDRLRERCKWFDEIKFGQEIALITEAANEIDRLLADLQSWEISARKADEAEEYELECLRQRCRWAENNAQSFAHECRQALDREENAQRILASVRKVRDGYADQARFADVEQAHYFREFVRRLDDACGAPKEQKLGRAALKDATRGRGE